MKNHENNKKKHEKPTWNHDKPWKTMKNHEKLTWKHKKPWKPTWNHEKNNLEPWKTMKTDLEPWKTNLEPWKPLKNLIWDRWAKWSFFVTNTKNLPIIYRSPQIVTCLIYCGSFYDCALCKGEIHWALQYTYLDTEAEYQHTSKHFESYKDLLMPLLAFLMRSYCLLAYCEASHKMV